MEWQSEVRDGSMIVGPRGPIDHQNADRFEAKLIPAVTEAAAVGVQLIIDLERVNYMSSVGLRVVVRADKAAKREGVSLAVANLNQTMREIFQISRFDKIIRVHGSLEEALVSAVGR